MEERQVYEKVHINTIWNGKSTSKIAQIFAFPNYYFKTSQMGIENSWKKINNILSVFFSDLDFSARIWFFGTGIVLYYTYTTPVSSHIVYLYYKVSQFVDFQLSSKVYEFFSSEFVIIFIWYIQRIYLSLNDTEVLNSLTQRELAAYFVFKIWNSLHTKRVEFPLQVFREFNTWLDG